MTELETTQRRLQAALADVCGHLNVQHERLVTLTREALQARAWEGHGIRSPEQWLAWQTGLSPERARQIVYIANRQVELPVTFSAFAEGLLSVDQVVVVAKQTPVHNDAEACQLAQAATVAQLRVALSKHFFPPPPPDSEPSAAAEATHAVVAGFNDDGDYFVHALADGAEGAVIDRALREAKDALFRAGNVDVTWLDALVEVCTRSLTTITSLSRKDLYKIVIHLDSEGGWVHNGPILPAALVDRICCDGTIQPLWDTQGRPINMGRQCHIVPLRTRIVVEDRDRICRHPTCHSSVGLQVHHITHWNKGGPTDTNNLCCLCSRHHSAHHRGHFAIAGDADRHDGLTFTDANGHPIKPCGTPKPPGDTPSVEPDQRYAHPTGERLQHKWLDFTPPPAQPPPRSANN